MTQCSRLLCFRTSPDSVPLAVILNTWFPLQLRNLENLLRVRGVNIGHGIVRFWWNSSGPVLASGFRKRRFERTRPSCRRWERQQRTTRPVAGRRPRKRGAQEFRDEEPRQEGRIEILEEIVEAAWSRRRTRHRAPAIRRRRAWRIRHPQTPANRPMKEELWGEFAPAILKARVADAALPEDPETSRNLRPSTRLSQTIPSSYAAQLATYSRAAVPPLPPIPGLPSPDKGRF